MAEVIDAENQTLGRLASQIAVILQGKDKSDYEPRKIGGRKVVVKNIHLIKLTSRKASQKVYYRHSGRPGHLKKTRYSDIFSRRPEWVLRHAVLGMLPKNRLRAKRIKLLTFEK